MKLFIECLISSLYIKVIWGKRCSTYEESCIVCEKWKEHDEMFE